MSSAKTIVKNSGFLLSTEIFDKITSFFLVVIITRYLGVNGFGKYSFAFAFIGMFVLLSDIGLVTYLFREISKDKSKTKKLVDNVMSLRLMVTAVVFLIAIMITKFWPKANEIIPAILIVEVHELFRIIISLIWTIFNSYERNEFRLYSVIIEKSLSLGLVACILTKGYGLFALLGVLVIAKALNLLYCYIISYKNFVRIGLGADIPLWKSLVKSSIPFWFSLIFLKIFDRINIVMLTSMKDYVVTGLYNAASTIISALSFIPAVIINATFPAMSQFYHLNSKEVLRILYKKSFYYMVIIVIPIILGTLLLSQRIIQFVYKESFKESGVILQILILSILFVFLNLLMGYLLNAINKQYFFTISNGLCVILNITLNFMLIPEFSYRGTAFAILITQIINFCLLYYFTTINGYFVNPLKIVYKPLVAGAIMSFIIIQLSSLQIVYLVPIAAISYFITLFLIKGFGKDEVMLVKSLLKKNG